MNQIIPIIFCDFITTAYWYEKESLIEYLIEYGTNVNLLSYIKHLLNFEFYEASVLMIECKNGSEDTIKCRL